MPCTLLIFCAPSLLTTPSTFPSIHPSSSRPNLPELAIFRPPEQPAPPSSTPNTEEHLRPPLVAVRPQNGSSVIPSTFPALFPPDSLAAPPGTDTPPSRPACRRRVHVAGCPCSEPRRTAAALGRAGRGPSLPLPLAGLAADGSRAPAMARASHGLTLTQSSRPDQWGSVVRRG
ncbi:hypothetical protein GQ55_9G373900 [Panicum hallii var. hallii]|uniref:Uncharacterized protein n=1 Tax=Panicum hallii var. hallii TaxID=1504633 RepID=A0A2T7C917_9POAL|nr:hypothetical protein GQ55_9G373900 [Panicum hallii var. hallii]